MQNNMLRNIFRKCTDVVHFRESTFVMKQNVEVAFCELTEYSFADARVFFNGPTRSFICNWNDKQSFALDLVGRADTQPGRKQVTLNTNIQNPLKTTVMKANICWF